jgi:hypothetical protein
MNLCELRRRSGAGALLRPAVGAGGAGSRGESETLRQWVKADGELAEVVLAGLVGYAQLAAAGLDVDPAPFRRALRSLFDRHRN